STKPDSKTIANSQYNAFMAKVQSAGTSGLDGPGNSFVTSNWSEKELKDLKTIVTGMRDNKSITHLESEQADAINTMLKSLVTNLQNKGTAPYQAIVTSLEKLNINMDKQIADKIAQEPAALKVTANNLYKELETHCNTSVSSKFDGPPIGWIWPSNLSQSELAGVVAISEKIMGHEDSLQSSYTFEQLDEMSEMHAAIIKTFEGKGDAAYKATLTALKKANIGAFKLTKLILSDITDPPKVWAYEGTKFYWSTNRLSNMVHELRDIRNSGYYPHMRKEDAQAMINGVAKLVETVNNYERGGFYRRNDSLAQISALADMIKKEIDKLKAAHPDF
ncbi:hypothetical protein KAI87_03605, partial [Myxococcota bacterium]|nr:hypothetical protein [Myxococcota bacterium]